MTAPDLLIKTLENKIESALTDHETQGALEEALLVYSTAETELERLRLAVSDPSYPDHQRVLSYCLLRQANIRRQQGEMALSRTLGERSIAAAESSRDKIALARSLLAHGPTNILLERVEAGVQNLEDAYALFSSGDSPDHRQGVGWYWLLRADLMNAGFLEGPPDEILSAAKHALDALLPIDNRIGIARAYHAMAAAYTTLGDTDAAAHAQANLAKLESKSQSP